MKDVFAKSSFYKSGQIYLNKQIDNNFELVKSFEDIGVKKRNYQYNLYTGRGQGVVAFAENGAEKDEKKITQTDISISDIPTSIVRKGLSRNPFYTFSTIKHYFPHVLSTQDFIQNKNYLAGLSITFTGTPEQTQNIPIEDKLEAISGLLAEVEKDLKTNTAEKIGSKEFIPHAIGKVFYNKTLKINKKSERADGQLDFVMDKSWYVYNANYGTSEEKAFVRMLARHIEGLKKKYTNIYLVRNEQHFKIYNFRDGQPFQPDFVLYMKDKSNKTPLTYQIFVEPKGKYLQPIDKWKEEFLLKIKTEFKDKILKFSENQKYRIIGVPFYNNEDENAFQSELQDAL